MELLRKTKTYLAGAMQYENGRGWRDSITPSLLSMGVTVFNPYSKPFVEDSNEAEDAREKMKQQMECGDYDSVAERMKRVRSFDLRLVDLSDFIVAYVNPKIASWGTAEELVTACRQKKVTFIIIDGGKPLCPYWILGMFPHKYIYGSVEEAVDMLEKINSGEKPIDSDRWKLLRSEYR
jgi:nucleoside 2-deoxyribosyltransferase